MSMASVDEDNGLGIPEHFVLSEAHQHYLLCNDICPVMSSYYIGLDNRVLSRILASRGLPILYWS